MVGLSYTGRSPWHLTRSHCRCPITMLPMTDPLTAADGFSYERWAIERWLALHDTSPQTNQRLANKQVVDCSEASVDWVRFGVCQCTSA